MVVSNIFYFHPYLGKIPILTNIFQMGWNHQPGKNKMRDSSYSQLFSLIPEALGRIFCKVLGQELVFHWTQNGLDGSKHWSIS